MRRIEDPPEVDGVLGTAVRQATRYRAAIVRPIKVRSAAIRDFALIINAFIGAVVLLLLLRLVGGGWGRRRWGRRW